MKGEAGLDDTGPETGERDAAGKAGFGESGARQRGAPDMPDLDKLAQDWITLWQSELSAMAADREMRESWQSIAALWAGTMAAVLRGLPRDLNAARHDGTHRRAGPADAPRAAPTAAASDARDAEIERLARHVTALEHRLAELERGGSPAVDPKRRPRRKQRD
jgi:uncharacterized membrane protein YccC